MEGILFYFLVRRLERISEHFALVADSVPKDRNQFNQLHDGEQHQEEEQGEELNQDVPTEDYQSHCHYCIPEEVLSHVNQLYYLPSLLELLAPSTQIPNVCRRDIVQPAFGVDWDDCRIGWEIKDV